VGYRDNVSLEMDTRGMVYILLARRLMTAKILPSSSKTYGPNSLLYPTTQTFSLDFDNSLIRPDWVEGMCPSRSQCYCHAAEATDTSVNINKLSASDLYIKLHT